MNRRRPAIVALLSALSLTMSACPPMTEAARDGGTMCNSAAQCNASGATCGTIRQCVAGFCSDTTTVVACRDGGYPDAGVVGNCATYEDCNPAPACGNVIACINFVCDPGTLLDIPCRDVVTRDATGTDTSTPPEAGLADAGASDAFGE